MSGRISSVFCILLFVGGLLAGIPVASAESSIANVRFEAALPAPTVALAASQNGHHVLVADEEAHFTFIPSIGEDELVWQAPGKGLATSLGVTLGQVSPQPIGVAVTPSGDYWAGAANYDDEYGGQLWAFARWSDQPIWTYDLTDGSRDADQASAVTAGGSYIAMGTEKGKVYIFTAADQGGSEKMPYRTYSTDNQGNPFPSVGDVAMSRDGGRILIGTGQNDKGSLHLYSIKFFMHSFKRVTEPVELVEISPDGSRGAAVTGKGANARLHFLDLDRGRTLWETTIGQTVSSVALSEDGKTLVAGTERGRVLVFVEKGSALDRDPHMEHKFVDAVHTVTVADDGRAIAAGTSSGKLLFLDRDRSSPLWIHEAGSAVVASAIAADGDVLVFSSTTSTNGRVIYTAADRQIEHMAPTQPRLAPSALATVPIQLANNGNRLETITLEWGTLSKGWEGHPGEISLAPGEQGTLSAKLQVAKGQAAGTYPVPLVLIIGSERIQITMDAVVPEMTSGQTIERWSLQAAIPGGAPAAFLFRLENTGNTLNTATLGYAKLPAGWRAEFIGPSEFRLKPGEDREVALKVWAPASAQVGREAWLDVVVAWTNGEERLPVSVRLVDVADYRALLRIDADDAGGLPDELENASHEPIAVDEKDSPGVGLVVILGALGLLGIAVRRQRRG